MNHLVEIQDVSKQYKVGSSNIKALDHVDLTIDRGQMISVMGPSGSGKTTLLNILGCLDVPDSGRVLLEGVDVCTQGDRERTRLRLHKIGFVFQQFYLIPTLTAYENVRLPMNEARVPRNEADFRTESLLNMVGLGDRRRHKPSQLSGGEQQRVAIARAMANQPEIILADEPTGELDSANADMIVELLRDLVDDKGLTVVVVTHDPGVADKANVTVNMKDGRIV